MNIHVDRPDKQGRKEILKVHLKDLKIEENLDIDKLAGLTSRMVGADLANLINEAALLAVRRGKMSKSELLNRMATLLGGRAAEEIVFEDISTGAHNDLARATDIARSMVKEYGMSAKVGQIYFAREKRNQFLNIPTEGAVEYSEATAELIDSEVREIINNQYKRTMEILLQKRDILDNGARI